MPMRNPPHPGWIVRPECIEALDPRVTDGARALGISRNALSELINERRGPVRPGGPYPSARGTQGMRETSIPSSARASASSGVVSP